MLATIESNQSLTVYELRAPIAGTVIERQVALGEYASEQKAAFHGRRPLDRVGGFLGLSPRPAKVRVGDTVLIDPEDGGAPVAAKISYISPVGSSDTQSALARATVANQDGRLRPGLFVTGRLLLVREAGRRSPSRPAALQTMENRTVVFVRAARSSRRATSSSARATARWSKSLFGLVEGDIYAAKNSFVIKAEIGKASASALSTEGRA